MTQPLSSHDVVIMGGGLAGLTLALQLKQRFADIDVLVIERKAHPVPLACHKVGESSVEIGAHYFEQVLGLKGHLQDQQLRKFGFRFFFSEGRRDIDQVTELGVSRSLKVSSWQIDRGIFENFLGEEALRRGIRFVDQALVREIHIGVDALAHQVVWQCSGQPPQRAAAPWLIDASGRAGLLKRKLGLAKDNAHAAHAVWFRIAAHIKVDDWSADPAWRSRCDAPRRWLSTNHLVGEGYWAWLIPLASGSHSVGIVADPRFHAHESMNSFDKAMDWLQRYQPRLFDALDGQRDKLQDFAFFRRFSYDCTQVFSADRWALAGEAGRFLDPFYSPGSDFIAIGNTYITELIALDRAGQRLGAHCQVFEQIFRSFYDNTLTLYQDQYGLFGDPEVLPVKILWDYSYYWGVLSQFFFQNRLHDLSALAQLREELEHCQRLNLAVQGYLREWGQVSLRRNPPQLLDQAELPWFAALNAGLLDTLDDRAFRQRLRESTLLLRQLALQILERGSGQHTALIGAGLKAAIAATGGPAHHGESLLFAMPAQAQPA